MGVIGKVENCRRPLSGVGGQQWQPLPLDFSRYRRTTLKSGDIRGWAHPPAAHSPTMVPTKSKLTGDYLEEWVAGGHVPNPQAHPISLKSGEIPGGGGLNPRISPWSPATIIGCRRLAVTEKLMDHTVYGCPCRGLPNSWSLLSSSPRMT
ncbi:hypothetical protein CRG98_023161 [Punica granatum]|uniref:Uncharacterized protein n=1 Tax=Punica granatum TaxID=22663 RepID=A0A2I0JKD7_PUNGR|nr:hypothetical protein CRG98_023161 [Punica granatum]